MSSEPYKDKLNVAIEDTLLWEELKKGKLEAFERIYQDNIQALFEYGMHIHTDLDLVKDALQELFIHIWQRRATLGDVKNIRNYLIVCFRRGLIRQLEAQKKELHTIQEKVNYLIEAEVSHESHLIAKEASLQQERNLMEAIDRLPARQREILYLLFFKKFPQKEIAKIMSINLASVYTLASKALKNLKNQIK